MNKKAGDMTAGEYLDAITRERIDRVKKAHGVDTESAYWPVATPASILAAEDCDMVTACCNRKECGGECGNEWQGMVSPEERAEAFIQAEIDRAPEPLRRLGEFLANLLDDDHFKTAERMLLAIATGNSREVEDGGGAVAIGYADPDKLDSLEVGLEEWIALWREDWTAAKRLVPLYRAPQHSLAAFIKSFKHGYEEGLVRVPIHEGASEGFRHGYEAALSGSHKTARENKS